MYEIMQLLGFLCLLYIPIGLIFPKIVPFAKSRLKTLAITVPALLIIAIIGISFQPAEVTEQIRVEREQKAQVAAAEAKAKTDAIQAKAKAEADAKAAEERKIAEAKAEQERKAAEEVETFRRELFALLPKNDREFIEELKIENMGNMFQMTVYIRQGYEDLYYKAMPLQIVKGTLDWLMQKGHQPSDEKIDIIVFSGQKTKGATGKELFRTFGNASYNWRNDTIEWDRM